MWMMLEERKKLHDEKRELQAQNEALQRQLDAKDHELEALQVDAVARSCCLHLFMISPLVCKASCLNGR